jgi:hypothetical protein
MRYEFTARLLHAITTLIVLAAISLNSNSASKAAGNADSPRNPNVVSILADDKYAFVVSDMDECR